MELSLTADVLDDFLIPIRKRLAGAQVAEAEYRVAETTLALAEQVKVAVYTLQAGRQFRDRVKSIADAGDAAAEVVTGGNLMPATSSRLDLATQLASAQQAQLELMRTGCPNRRRP